MRHCVELRGLIGSNPLGAMAAFGLLRLVAEHDAHARLRWIQADDWIAVLESVLDQEALLAWVGERALHTTLAAFDWAKADVRVEPGVYRKALVHALDGDATHAGYLTGIAVDGAVDKSKGLAKPSAFYMVSGQQSFLGGLRAILSDIRRDPVDRCREALLGPWRYRTDLHGLGWDPAGERLHALRYRTPTGEKPSCVAAAVWLAFEALPLFPVLARAGREETTGFRRRRGERARKWVWPLTSRPVSIDSLRCLVQAPMGKDALRPGVAAIYESERYEFGQGYAVFRPARRIA